MKLNLLKLLGAVGDIKSLVADFEDGVDIKDPVQVKKILEEIAAIVEDVL